MHLPPVGRGNIATSAARREMCVFDKVRKLEGARGATRGDFRARFKCDMETNIQSHFGRDSAWQEGSRRRALTLSAPSTANSTRVPLFVGEEVTRGFSAVDFGGAACTPVTEAVGYSTRIPLFVLTARGGIHGLLAHV